MWEQLEPTQAHLVYLVIPSFLILYALFSNFIRNRLHLSEPPIALLFGIILGPNVLGLIKPKAWGQEDQSVQEFTRLIIGITVFVVGVEVPRFYFIRHWRSVAMLIGPVMIVSWLITALLCYAVLQTGVWTSLIIAACLSPTDPVLAASILKNSKFSNRVPNRLRHLLSAESGCNDGTSFPLLYVGLCALNYSTFGSSFKEWFLITILWQCTFGLLVGFTIGYLARQTMKYCDSHGYIGRSSFVVFYLLLAILTTGLGATLGSDDFLVAFGAGVGFARDGWFAAKTKAVHLPNVVDLLLNSSMFVYFGTVIPWSDFSSNFVAGPHLTPLTLLAFLILVLLLRRIPVVVACKFLIPDVRTYREALFCGHFGPMGIGALFLAMEARAQLETGTSIPLPTPPDFPPDHELSETEVAIQVVWPVICFVVMGSTIVHGLSVAAVSVGSHYSRPHGERAPLIGGENEPLGGMVHYGGGGESASDLSMSDEEQEEGVTG